jgi:hypothetical protein
MYVFGMGITGREQRYAAICGNATRMYYDCHFTTYVLLLTILTPKTHNISSDYFGTCPTSDTIARSTVCFMRIYYISSDSSLPEFVTSCGWLNWPSTIKCTFHTMTEILFHNDRGCCRGMLIAALTICIYHTMDCNQLHSA